MCDHDFLVITISGELLKKTLLKYSEQLMLDWYNHPYLPGRPWLLLPWWADLCDCKVSQFQWKASSNHIPSNAVFCVLVFWKLPVNPPASLAKIHLSMWQMQTIHYCSSTLYKRKCMPWNRSFFAYNLKSSLTDTLPKFLFASVIPPGFICLCHVQGRCIIEMLNEGKQIYHKIDCSLFFKALSAMAGTLGTTYLLSQLKAASMTLGSALTCHDNIVRQLWNH